MADKVEHVARQPPALTITPTLTPTLTLAPTLTLTLTLTKVEHVARLNERGNRILLQPEPSPPQLRQAGQRFEWGLQPHVLHAVPVGIQAATLVCCRRSSSSSGGCAATQRARYATPTWVTCGSSSTSPRRRRPACAHSSRCCHSTPTQASASNPVPNPHPHLHHSTFTLALNPHQARFGLGVALRAQRRDAEAVAAYESALEVTPLDFDTWANMAAALGSLGEYTRETAAYQKAVEIRPDDVKAWLNLGISRTSAGEHAEAEAAFASASAADPQDPRPPMNLGRLLASLSRPAEAVASFYAASALNSEYFDEVKLGVGTARAMQGRLQQASRAPSAVAHAHVHAHAHAWWMRTTSDPGTFSCADMVYDVHGGCTVYAWHTRMHWPGD